MKRGRLCVVAIALTTVITALGLPQLRVSTDNRNFYGPNNPYFQDFLEFESTFTTNDNIVFVLHAPYKVAEQNYPEAIRWLTERSFALPNVIRVDSLANYPYPTMDGESLAVDSILDWACPPALGCVRSMQEALNSSQLYGRLASNDEKAAAVIATLSIERGAVGQIELINQHAKQLAKDFQSAHPDLEIYFTGGVPMMAAFAEATADDLSLLLPIALVTIYVLLTLVLGSSVVAGILLGTGMLASIIVLGCAGWAGLVINNATSITPVVIMVLVVTSAMHIAVPFSNNLMGISPTCTSAYDQAVACTKSSTTPILASAATSAVSLASLAFVDSPPFQQLGILAASGVIVGCALTLTLLPVALAVVSTIRNASLSTFIQRSVDLYAKRVEASGAPARSVALALVLASLGLLQLNVDDDFVAFFDTSVDFRVQTDKATELLAGPNHIELVLEAPEGTSVFDPNYLQYQDTFAKHVRQYSMVASVHSFSNVMDQISRVFYDTELSTANSDEELSQLYLIYELSLRLGQTNTDLVSADQRATRISVLLKETSSSDIQALEASLYRFHGLSATPYSLTVTGENIPVAHLSQINISSVLVGIVIALAFTSIALGFLFHSMRLGVVSLVATTVPVIAGFGIWGWAKDSIGLAATGVIALTIGVVVDDAAHYLHRFLHAVNTLRMVPEHAAAYATHRVGSAIVSTSIVLGIGLAVLMLSDFQVNSTFGAVTSLIILLALIFDLAVLPKLAVWGATARR